MPRDSHFWSVLIKVKCDFFRLGKFNFGNRAQIRFWEDIWFRSVVFQDLYPDISNIVCKKIATVETAFSTKPLDVTFRRSLVASNFIAWHQLVAIVMNTYLLDERDVQLGSA